MGNVACFRLHRTLSHVPQLSYLANAHGRCLHCSEGYHTGIQASYKHTFWDCDATRGLWRKVNQIFKIIGRTNPLQQWHDLPLLLVDENSPSSRSCYRTVGGMIDTEIIGVTLWAIWSGYIDAINFEHEHTNPATSTRKKHVSLRIQPYETTTYQEPMTFAFLHCLIDVSNRIYTCSRITNRL